jgi:pimeloyl-ACP methyl ester carboxylesterase
VIAATGGRATLAGSSSGAVLALRAAARLPDAVNAVVAFEPPLIVDDSRPPVPADAAERVKELLDDDRAGAAVRYFFGEIMGIPRIGVAAMRLLPGWSKSVAMAPTLLNDLAVLDGLQAGRPVNDEDWRSITVPVLLLTGAKSEPFFERGASQLAAAIPNAVARVMPGLHHGSVVMGAASLADEIAELTMSAGGPA